MLLRGARTSARLNTDYRVHTCHFIGVMFMFNLVICTVSLVPQEKRGSVVFEWRDLRPPRAVFVIGLGSFKLTLTSAQQPSNLRVASGEQSVQLFLQQWWARACRGVLYHIYSCSFDALVCGQLVEHHRC